MKPYTKRAAQAALLCYCLFTAAMSSAQAYDIKRADLRAFAELMQREHGLNEDAVLGVLSQAVSKESILKAISRPAEKSKPWHEYQKIFINQKRIDNGIAFYRKHASSLERVARETGVPAEIIVSIIGIETNYGRITGSYRVLDALSTLAFDYPPRSEFFTRELENFFLLTREEQVDILTVKGSYAGAMGAAQFMPSSYRLYATDGDDDGRRDLWGSWEDAFTSIAHYFLDHGWRPGQPSAAPATADRNTARILESKILTPAYRLGFLREQGVEFETTLDDNDIGTLIPYELADGDEHLLGFHNFFVITRYNRSRMYARCVLNLGAAVAAGIN
ncbi:MAG: lytic murein transglycosylase B [Gammaproteobacteria bacterium]